MTQLLAYNGTAYNQRQGRLGKLLHDNAKWFIRKASTTCHRMMVPIFKYHEKNKPNMPGVDALEEAFNFVISLDDLPVNKGIGGFKDIPGGDQNKKLFMEMRDILCAILREDSHYHMRTMVLLKYVHDHWDERFEIASNQADHLLRFGEMYGELIESLKKLPEDDGMDVEDIDMVEFTKQVRGK